MAGSDSAIKRRLAKLGIGQSKLHAQTQRNHMCTPINAATQKTEARTRYGSGSTRVGSGASIARSMMNSRSLWMCARSTRSGSRRGIKGVVIVRHVGSRPSRGFAAKHGDVMPDNG